MNKNIIISLAVIGVVAAIAITGTIAYFSDTETSVGNTFTAGTINIKLNPKGGQAVETVSGDLDLKPSQTGYTKSVITNVGTNPAEIWKHIGEVENLEHGIVEPEAEYYNDIPASENWLMSNWIHYDLMAYKALGYSWSGTVGNQPVNISVENGEGQVTWTIDFPMVAPYDSLEGNGSLVVGLVIALDGDGNGPAYQIHNNDGTDATYPWGTWLMSPWGPTIGDGWFGWHSGDTNTPVADLDWVSGTGDRHNEDNPDGIFTITIDKCELAGDIHWALNLAIGSGFSGQYYTYEQMAYPIATPGPSFNWGTPIVNMALPNYEAASISTLTEEILETEGFFLTGQTGVESNWIYLGELEPEESMCVIQSYHLDSTVDNWAQSDRVKFDMDFMAQQTTPLPDPPASVLPGHGR